MKTKKPKKEVNNSSAFSQPIDKVEKEKKKLGTVGSLLIGCTVGGCVVLFFIAILIAVGGVGFFNFLLDETEEVTEVDWDWDDWGNTYDIGIDNKQLQIDECIREAYTRYRDGWLETCRINNIPILIDEDGSENCVIPMIFSEQLEESYGKDKDRCVERYK